MAPSQIDPPPHRNPGRRAIFAERWARGLVLVALAIALAPPGLTGLPSIAGLRAANAQAPGFRRIATVGQAAPGGGIFGGFDVDQQPVPAPVNAKGEVAFYASLGRSQAEEGIFLHTGRDIVRVAVQGDALPKGGVLSGFATHPQIALNNSGTVVFSAAVAEAGTTEGLFQWKHGQLDAIALAGTKAPGISSGTFAEFTLPALNDAGVGVFIATVRRGRETLEGIFRFREGRIEKVVAAGDPAPGGGTYSAFGVPAINNSGTLAFPALVDQGDVLGGLFAVDARGGSLVAGAGEPAPGGGIFYKFSERVGLDDAGRVVVLALLKDAASTAAIVRFDAGKREMLTSMGSAAPGGGTIASFASWVMVNPGGAIAFVAGLDGGPSPMALLGWDERGLRRLASQGGPLDARETLAGFPPYPVVSLSPAGGVTFATVAVEGRGKTGIAYVGP